MSTNYTDYTKRGVAWAHLVRVIRVIRGLPWPGPVAGGYWVGRGLGSIYRSPDEDWWSFEAFAGDVLSVSVDTPDSTLDPQVYLYNASGSSLASDLYDGPDNDAFIRYAGTLVFLAAQTWFGQTSCFAIIRSFGFINLYTLRQTFLKSNGKYKKNLTP